MVKPSDITIHGYCMRLLTLEQNRLNWELRKSNMKICHSTNCEGKG